MITVTANAARKIRSLVDGKEAEGLRLKVVGGGCSGLQYKMDVGVHREGDRVFELEGAKVFADRKSYLYLHGSELDYAESLMESGFHLTNPNVKRSCGCGNSFSV
ncbi:MAG: iron-sulfur cluster assembly protein [Candidatus Binatota bacterium]|nr:iron-sulfur cluster assembly protein [Candidatus Binatota bacterium]